MRFLATVLALACVTTALFGIAPGAPIIPEVEFKVLPSPAQDFFANDASPIHGAFAPVTEIAQPADAFAAMGGSAVEFAWNTNAIARKRSSY
jgi:hypothetical protein